MDTKDENRAEAFARFKAEHTETPIFDAPSRWDGFASPAVLERPLRQTELRGQRLDELMTSCREQILQQIIGPFGLTPAMFEDKVGGNVTTQYNADQGIFAKESEQFNRSEYQYQTAKTKKMREAVKNGQMNSNEFIDEYTGTAAPTKRTNNNGKLVMNAELDHTIPLKDAHRQGGWMLDKEGRKQISSEEENLHFTTFENNRAKGAKPAQEYLSSENNFDEAYTAPIIEKAQAALDEHMPSRTDRAMYHGKELLATGAVEAGRNALRQAMGVLLYEFVNGSYIEITKIIKEPISEESIIDQVVGSLKNVLDRVITKLHKAFEALVSGGVQGFVSNFLTFVINSVITTSAKVVTVIREGIRGLWDALTLVANPPQALEPMEVARQATKIIAGVVTMSLGMVFEESVKGFIASFALLIPLADVIAPVITGILTGLMTALTIYTLDRLFDWLSSKGTAHLNAQLSVLDVQVDVAGRLAALIDTQRKNSRLYERIGSKNNSIAAKFSQSQNHLASAIVRAENIYSARENLASSLAVSIAAINEMDNELDEMLMNYYQN